VRLSAERDTKLLLELILTKARDITRSDAGSIYTVETATDGSRRLRFELAQNDSVPVEFNAVALPLSSESLAGHVALTGEILDVADAYALPPDRPYRFNPEVDSLAGYRTKSLLVLPMRTPGGDIIGVLALINRKRESGRPFPSTAAIEREALAYSAPSRRLAASLASQAAVALANSGLFRELTRRQGRLEALVDVSQRATRLWPPATVQRRIADLYAGLLQADAMAFHLVDGDRLVRAEVRGEDMAALLRAEIAIGEGPTGRVAATGAPEAIMDLAGHAGLEPTQRESAARLGLRAWLAVPVHAGDRLVGVLSASRPRPPRSPRTTWRWRAPSRHRPASRSRTRASTPSWSGRSRACGSPRTSSCRWSGCGRSARWPRAWPTTSTISWPSSCCAPSCCSRGGRLPRWRRA
jgi:GAF domain-containing protein